MFLFQKGLMMTLFALPLARLGKLGRKAFDLFLGIPFVFFPLEAYDITVTDVDKALIRIASEEI